MVTQFPYGTSGGRTTLPIHYLKYKESNTRDDLSSYYKTVARPRTNTLSSSKTDCSTYQVFSNDLSTKTICSYLITTISYLIPSFSSNQQAPLLYSGTKRNTLAVMGLSSCYFNSLLWALDLGPLK